VLEEVAEWQNRPLDAVYPLVFFDAIRVKIRDEGFVRKSYAGKWVTGFEKAAYRGGCRILPELPKGTIRHGEDYRRHRLSSAGNC